ncbi:MAG: alpha/beta hydrolase [Proteobacteria bacterium]|nr:alpha/beta hydrolase [Pseudomonadota bacterium]
MYFVTNRRYDSTQTGFNKLTKYINPKGQNELRLLRLDDTPTQKVALLRDRLSKKKVRKLNGKYNLGIDLSQNHYASLEVACVVFDEAQRTGKSVLVFVHGYNNDIEDIYKTGKGIENLYNVIVVVFTWPSNGGGALSGTLSYIADKRDARGSTDALNRFVDMIGKYHLMLTSAAQEKLKEKAIRKHPSNPTQQRAYLAELIINYCNVTINLLCHSMGNYVLKKALGTTLSESKTLVFDNVILAAADTNNNGHADWVDSLNVRHSIYIIINENDSALSWSRRKPGEEQKARLGHYLRNLKATKPYYVDVTDENAVGISHSYFGKSVVDNNQKLKTFFKHVFSAMKVQSLLEYVSGVNTYRLKK